MKKALVIGFVWPEPNSSAAGRRIIQLLKQLIEQGFTITFVSSANTTAKTFNLESLGVTTKLIKLNDTSFDDFIKELQPDLVMFDRFMTEEQYGWRVAEFCPNALRVLDTEDFHGLRKARELALKADVELSTEHLQNDTSKREIASIYRCDLSLIISQGEIQILTKQFSVDPSLLLYLPFLQDKIEASATNALPAFNEREHFITIGNFLHPPNFDAVLYLKQRIWPLIRSHLPKVELHIYGAYDSQKVTQLHNQTEGFIVKGFAEVVNDVMKQARVNLAPLRFGAGLKGKLIDAMCNGTPCAMSIVAAEGMFGEINANGFIEDDPKLFAEKAVELYTDSDKWLQKQQNGFKVINERFNKESFKKQFAITITDLQDNLKSHRQKNFMGSILRHQTLQSTKYMSKWIEEKNKN